MSADDVTEAAVPAPLMPEMTHEKAMKALEALRREYNTTVAALSVVTERLLAATGAYSVTITDDALVACPDLDAHRNTARRAVILRTTR